MANNKNRRVIITHIDKLLSALENAITKDLSEAIVWNSLSGPELRIGVIDKDVRAHVLLDFRRTISKLNVEGIDVIGMSHNLGSMGLKFTLEDIDRCLEKTFDDMDEVDNWPDSNIVPGTLVEIEQLFGLFKQKFSSEDNVLLTSMTLVSPFTEEKDVPRRKAMFLGWTSRTTTHKKRVYTQEWLVEEQVIVQNLPKWCYTVVKGGNATDEAPQFWNPKADFL